MPRLRRLCGPEGGAAHACPSSAPIRRRPCSSPASAARARFPYYMETYGFHTIHGRAPALATGVKLANPELDVWIITGDGDALSIGGNHTMHILRRNLELPDPAVQQRDLRPDQGPIFADQPRRHAHARRRRSARSTARPSPAPSRSARARASSRAAIDVHKNLPDVLKAAHAHQGAAFVEIFQNCIVYNDDVFAPFTDQGRRGKPALARSTASRCCSPAAPRA